LSVASTETILVHHMAKFQMSFPFSDCNHPFPWFQRDGGHHCITSWAEVELALRHKLAFCVIRVSRTPGGGSHEPGLE
jgi:hypothetical protein